MALISSWSLWIAGVAALLNALGFGRLNLEMTFIQINMTPLIVAAVCFFNAYIRLKYRTDA
jgi:hypothetical protein